MSARKDNIIGDGYNRTTYTLPSDLARSMAKDWFRKFPQEVYDTKVESWRTTRDGEIEFTMRRYPTAD